MKKVSFSLNVLLLVIIMLLLSFNATNGDNYTAGTEVDPVVTKSYVDNAIKNIKVESSANLKFEVIKVKKGDIITLDENSLFIVRAGKALAIDSKLGGLSDLTIAIDIKKDEVVELNHLILIPRTDGRGIKMESDGYIMISGGYVVK